MNDAARQRFHQLLQEHRGILFRVAHAYGRTPADREDLAQEIVSQLWSSFARFDESQRFSTWMYRVALNVAISFVRREVLRQRHLTSDDTLLESVAAEDTAPASEDLRRMEAAIAALAPIDRALVLLYLDGHSHQETAEVLGLTPTNVSTRLSRLKQALRRQLEGVRHE